MFSTYGQQHEHQSCVVFVYQTQHRFLNKKHLLYYRYGISLNYLFRKVIIWERKGSLKTMYKTEQTELKEGTVRVSF